MNVKNGVNKTRLIIIFCEDTKRAIFLTIILIIILSVLIVPIFKNNLPVT